MGLSESVVPEVQEVASDRSAGEPGPEFSPENGDSAKLESKSKLDKRFAKLTRTIHEQREQIEQLRCEKEELINYVTDLKTQLQVEKPLPPPVPNEQVAAILQGNENLFAVARSLIEAQQLHLALYQENQKLRTDLQKAIRLWKQASNQKGQQ